MVGYHGYDFLFSTAFSRFGLSELDLHISTKYIYLDFVRQIRILALLLSFSES